MPAGFDYTLIDQNGEQNLTVIVPGRDPLLAHESNPYFDKIVAGIRAGDDDVLDLIDLAVAAARKFERLSERVTVSNGRVYLDGDEIDNLLTKQIVKFIVDGVDDWEPLVKFFEKVAQNPSENSRKQLYTFINKNDLSLTPDGDLVAYKGVKWDAADKVHRSTTAGQAIVNGETYEGCIPNPIGGLVEMPRSEVRDNPHDHCSVGLHIATYDFAKSYGDTMLEVIVNPRDVVSVPHDSSQKVRCCRYYISKVIEQPHGTAVVEPTDLEQTNLPDLTTSKLLVGNPVPETIWNRIVSFAKSKKKGVAKVAEAEGLKLIGDDPKARESWTFDTPEGATPPPQAEWNDIMYVAKRQKKGVKSEAERSGYKLIGFDPKNRLHYTLAVENTE